MELEKTLAYLPTSIIYILAAYYFYDAPESLGMMPTIVFSAFFFSFIIASFYTVFFGRYISGDPASRKLGFESNKTTSIQLSIGIFLFSMYVSMIVVDEIMLSNVSMYIGVGFFVALGAQISQNLMLKFFNATKLHNGINIIDLPQYLIWYHYLIMFLLAIALINLFI